MECAQVTEEQRLWTETQIQKAKHNAWPSCLASVYLTNPPVAESRLKPLLKQLSPGRSSLTATLIELQLQCKLDVPSGLLTS